MYHFPEGGVGAKMFDYLQGLLNSLFIVQISESYSSVGDGGVCYCFGSVAVESHFTEYGWCGQQLACSGLFEEDWLLGMGMLLSVGRLLG